MNFVQHFQVQAKYVSVYWMCMTCFFHHISFTSILVHHPTCPFNPPSSMIDVQSVVSSLRKDHEQKTISSKGCHPWTRERRCFSFPMEDVHVQDQNA